MKLNLKELTKTDHRDAKDSVYYLADKLQTHNAQIEISVLISEKGSVAFLIDEKVFEISDVVCEGG